MAATPGYVNSAVITWAASTTATVSGQSIGTASWDRVVVVAVSIEADFDISSCTIGGTAATAGPVLRNTGGTPDISTAFFYRPVPTGTTADIGVTLSGSSSSIGRISTWAMTGAYPAHVDSGSGSGSGASITLATVTVPTNGCGMWAWANATNTAVAWTPSGNPSERDDAGAGTSGTAYRHSVADTVTAGTASVVADGATAQQVIVGMSFNENPPAMGWDYIPLNTKAPQSVNAAAMMMAASGMILAPYPYVQPEIPEFAHASTTSGYAFAKNLYYQAKIAPPPQEAVFIAPTTMDWVQPLGTIPPRTKPTRSQAIYAFPPRPNYAAFDVQTTYLTVKVLHYQDRFEPIVVVADDNNQTIDKWLQPLSKAVPRPPVYSALYTPFVPKEATRENTQTPDQWLTPFQQAKPHAWPAKQDIPFVRFDAPPVTPAQWMQPFTRAVPALHLNVSQVTYAAPPAVENNLTTTLEWLRPWQGPPSYSPPAISASPFVPKEVVLENTITGIPWLQKWQAAVPTPPTWPTQPFFGYPYISAPTLTTTLEWLRPWPVPPRYTPPRIAASPFVPKEAVRENTQTPDKWLKPLGVAVKRPPVWPTQPFFGYPYQAQANLTTTLEWLQAWKGPPRYQPVKTYYQPWHPQPPITVTVFSVFSVETVQVSKRALFYDDWSILSPYPYVGVVADAGPADEHERIACVPLASRVAIVPELSRVVEVPINDREQDSNEYRDRSCGTPETPVATEPEVPTEESPFQEDTFQHEDDAFQ